MSTHNIGFYKDLRKIIFELSSNIIKYAPYFFCCLQRNLTIENCFIKIQNEWCDRKFSRDFHRICKVFKIYFIISLQLSVKVS